VIRRDHDRADQHPGPLLEAAQQVLGGAELLGDLHPALATAERDGRDPVDVTTDVDVLVLHQPGRLGTVGDPAVVGADGQRRVGVVDDRAAGAEDLHDRARGPDDVVARGVVVLLGDREVVRLQLLLADLVPQVRHDLREHGLLVHAHEAGGGVVAQESDEDGDARGDGRERHGEGGPKRGHLAQPGPQPQPAAHSARQPLPQAHPEPGVGPGAWTRWWRH
jgi:hypothetical protein